METRLNLMSPDNKHALRTAVITASLQSLMLLVLSVSVIIALLLLGFRFTMKQMVSDVSERSTSSSGEYRELSRRITAVNDFVARASKRSESAVNWSETLETLSDSAPDGITFEGISILADGGISLRGSAKTRDDVLSFERKLKGLHEISDVSSPLSNILQRENLKFEFGMKRTLQEKK